MKQEDLFEEEDDYPMFIYKWDDAVGEEAGSSVSLQGTELREQGPRWPSLEPGRLVLEIGDRCPVVGGPRAASLRLAGLLFAR